MNRFRQKIQVTVIALALGLPGMTQGDDSTADAPSQFARVAKDELDRPRALQLAIVTYVPREDARKFSVDLISAIHIGDKAYYAQLNHRFRDYDALLYELVIPEDMEVPRSISERKGFISSTQLAMTKALDLSFQLDEIDYKQPNFVHADLSSAELAQSMVDRGESLYVYFWRVVYASLEEYAKDPLGMRDWRILLSLVGPDRDGALKTAIAYDMTRIDLVRDVLDGDNGSAIIAARNQRALQVLRKEIESGGKRIGIFYGAAHMPDFEERLLTELALTRRETAWIDAWKLGSEPEKL